MNTLEPVSVALKFGFLAVMYLFLLWVTRSARRDLRGGAGQLGSNQAPGGGAGEENLAHRASAKLPYDRVGADPFGVPAAQRLHDWLWHRQLSPLTRLSDTISHNQLHDGQRTPLTVSSALALGTGVDGET